MQEKSERSILKDHLCEGTATEVVERYATLKERAAASDFGEFDKNIVVVDTETTGLSFTHDELIQIAAARMEGGEITEWYVTFVDPGKEIPEEIVHLTHITNEDVAGAPSPEDAVAGLVAFAGDAKMVAHNAEFDKTFLTKHPAGYPLLENLWLDSLDLARISLPRMRSHRLLDLVKAFDAPLSTHRADADVEATCAIFRILLAAVDAMPKELVKAIADLTTQEEWSTSAVFRYFSEAGSRGMFSLRDIRKKRVSETNRAKRAPLVDEEGAPLRQVVCATEKEVEEAFLPDGLVGSLYGDYERRVEQVAMARAVNRAFTRSENLMVEAGTGVGKSMAYLVPAVFMAKRSQIPVGVATKTNALLDQLIYHELPALSEALENSGEGPLTYASLKGFSHYPCLRKIEKLAHAGAGTRTIQNKEVSQAPSLAALLSFIEQTVFDDMDSLKIDYRTVPRWSITSSSVECLRRKCPFYGTSCFVHGARNRAESVDVVVTNHSLLFCDLAADGGLLPPIKHWVVDEAHGAESEARRAFSYTLSAEEMFRLADRVSLEDPSRNVFVRTERLMKAKTAGGNSVVATNAEKSNPMDAAYGVEPAAAGSEALLFSLTEKGRQAGEEFARTARDFAAHMKDLLYFDPNKKNKGYEVVELWVNEDIRRSETFAGMAEYGRVFMDAAGKLVTACQALVGYLEDFPLAAEVQREAATIALNAKEMLATADVVLGPTDERYAYAATLCKKNDRVMEKLEAMPVLVGPTLNELFYGNTYSVVYASATLAVGDSFESFERALGLNESEQSQTRVLELPSSYDFDTNMTVYIASDIPEPTDSRYLPALQDLLIRTHVAQQGSMLTLFTNRREMENCFDVVNPAIKAENLRLVCQKWGVSVKGLRDDFLADEHLSLFALKSFWEGFDAPGSTLKGVIIPKLPFQRPTDPLSCERAARDDAAWKHYVLPAAVIETKQAVGRLIRKATDTGVVIFADKRLITKSYGKAFIQSLPTKNVKVMKVDEIVSELQERYGVR